VIVQILNDIIRHDLPLAAIRIREANLDTFAKEQSLVSLQFFVSQGFNEVILSADHVLGVEREADISK
jgi:hypothetical protein